ncbi:MAG: hypothetical protein ACREJC_03580, partial [Tepidisphaeraceae bacterium]
VCTDASGTALTGLTSITNSTPNGEIDNVLARDIGSIQSDFIGVPKRNTEAAVNGVDVLAAGLPFNNQRVLINAVGSGINGGYIRSLSARKAIGNVRASSIQEIVANSDKVNDSKYFEGVVGPIHAVQTSPGTSPNAETGNIVSVQVGEGLLPSGTGDFYRSGIFADGIVGRVTNQGLGSDIRGDIISLRQTGDRVQTGTDGVVRTTPFTGIDRIELNNGSIIDADVMVVTIYEFGLETADFITIPGVGGTFGTPVNDINSITISGVGGIIGTKIATTNIGSIAINGGFGFINSQISQTGNSTVNQVVTDGYGIRNSSFEGGAAVNSIVARGTGKLIGTGYYTSSVRQSEKGSFDPFSGTYLDTHND